MRQYIHMKLQAREVDEGRRIAVLDGGVCSGLSTGWLMLVGTRRRPVGVSGGRLSRADRRTRHWRGRGHSHGVAGPGSGAAQAGTILIVGGHNVAINLLLTRLLAGKYPGREEPERALVSASRLRRADRVRVDGRLHMSQVLRGRVFPVPRLRAPLLVLPRRAGQVVLGVGEVGRQCSGGARVSQLQHAHLEERGVRCRDGTRWRLGWR